MIADVIKNAVLRVDGRGYAGKVEDITIPKLTLQTEDFRGGGMDMAESIDMGMEPLEASFTLLAFDKDALQLFGFALNGDVPVTIRGAMQSQDGSVKPVVVTLRGKITEMDPGSWKPGDKPSLAVTMAGLHYYKLEIDGDLVHEIDVRNMVRNIGGTDQLAAQRAALGL